ncbi:hypothetical protein AB4Y32_39590 [Paraburkholderia phymatum]|uniref:Uncharacterized protein n=1 Tax=Paraburkholderia phymatum TaxID=148447 RepID=A0ACC6UE22_9BURK
MTQRARTLFALSLTAIATFFVSHHALAGSPQQLAFETHAAFFSAETQLPAVLDQQVFVADASSPAAVGPQGIAHVAGVRNAHLSDPPSIPLYDARHHPLHITLGHWLGANGDVSLAEQPDGRERLSIELKGLVPDGLYSLFENHFDQPPVGFTPLDGSAERNTFRADRLGRALLQLDAPSVLTHDNAVLVVYHADGRSWGMQRGAIGVTAQHQLIARLP